MFLNNTRCPPHNVMQSQAHGRNICLVKLSSRLHPLALPRPFFELRFTTYLKDFPDKYLVVSAPLVQVVRAK